MLRSLLAAAVVVTTLTLVSVAEESKKQPAPPKQAEIQKVKEQLLGSWAFDREESLKWLKKHHPEKQSELAQRFVKGLSHKLELANDKARLVLDEKTKGRACRYSVSADGDAFLILEDTIDYEVVRLRREGEFLLAFPAPTCDKKPASLFRKDKK